MRILYSILFLACQLCYGAATKDCTELLKFKFDDREWVQAFSAGNDDGSILEYTLKGETIDNWSELVTVQRFTNIKASLDEYYNLFLKELQKQVKPAEVHTNVINKMNGSLFFEWWIDEGDSTQHEWFRIFKLPKSLLVLRYTTKQMDDVAKVRPVWEKILSNATVTQDCD